MSDQQEQEIVLAGLKARYFDAARSENYPHTPGLTKECDNLEQAIRKLNIKEKATQ